MKKVLEVLGVILTVVALVLLVVFSITYAFKREKKIWSDDTIVTQTVSVTPSPVEIVPNKLCIDTNADSSWHIQEAMDEWNKNGINIFASRSLTSVAECMAEIELVEIPLDPGKEWGRTQFMHKGEIFIGISSYTPLDRRRQVACHELGHVLGAAHTGAASCMNPDQPHDVPTADEIKHASGPWNHFKAASAMQGK